MYPIYQQRHDAAAEHLGRLYVDGLIVPQDDVEAYRWLHAHLKGAPPEWIAAHDVVAARLTPAQREKARRRRQS